MEALVFDVFGTLVDWRSSIARDLARFGAEHGIERDWSAFADAWRAHYVPAMDRVRRGETAWSNLDALHAASLRDVAAQFELPTLGEAERAWFVRRWHELSPWPDTRPGLARLRERYPLATLSNGNVALLVDLARFADLRFDAILSAELFEHYKPDPETYLGAARLLGVEPHDLGLVAAHNDDLRAAKALGLTTCFVARPTEYGLGQTKDLAPESCVDVAARDLVELAGLLGVVSAVT